MEENKRKAAIQATILKRNECIKKATQIVEEILQNPISEEWLLDVCHDLTTQNYQDAVEERALINFCGYPLCQNKLPPVPKKKYHICLKTNKVFDISERKNFCSNQCYKASNFLKEQLHSGPLWLKESADEKKFEILHFTQESGMVGDEVDFGRYRLNKVEATSIPSRPKSTLFQEGEQNRSPYVTPETLQKLARHIDKLSIENETPAEKSKAVSEGKKKKFQRGSDTSKVPDDFTSSSSAEKTSPVSKDSCQENYKRSTSKKEDSMELKMAEITKEHEQNKSVDSVDKNKSDSKTSIIQARAEDFVNRSSADTTQFGVQKPHYSENNSDLSAPTSETLTLVSSAPLPPVSPQEETFKLQKSSPDNKSPSSPLSPSIPSPLIIPLTACLTPLQQAESAIFEWTTLDTLKLIVGEERFVRLKEYCQSSASARPGLIYTPEQKERMRINYIKLCKKLDEEEKIEEKLDKQLLDSDDDEDPVPAPSSTLPSMEQLEKDAYVFNLKVKEFYNNQLELACVGKNEIKDDKPQVSKEDKPAPSFKRRSKTSGKKRMPTKEIKKRTAETKTQGGQSPSSKEPVLPLVDKLDQITIRRRLTLDRLNKTLPELLDIMKIQQSYVVSGLRRLVFTFRLESNNITYRPAAWTLIAVTLLIMLSKKDEAYQDSLRSAQANRFFNLLLQGMDTSFDKLVDITERALHPERLFLS